MDDFQCKSSDKSSPSFPEDADYDEEQVTTYNQASSHDHSPAVAATSESPMEKLSSDVTLVADDEDDDMEGIKPLPSNFDSPRPNGDMNDKKVHWTNRDVQMLLSRVEHHLNEFNIQKKHKSVWQAIGAEMEPYGFTTEHCYNKWKNLRRDVRLLVNNPNKIVKNGSILRQVARLILIIYPNVDANTMQVTDRSPFKSPPTTPASVNKLSMDVSYGHYNSPHGRMGNQAPSRQSNPLFAGVNSSNVHSAPSSVEKTFCASSKAGNAPASALFVDSRPNGVQKDQSLFNQPSHQESNSAAAPGSSTPFSFPFNATAASLLLQSQFFNDMMKSSPMKNMIGLEGAPPPPPPPTVPSILPKPDERVHDLSTSQANGSADATSTPNVLALLQQAFSSPLPAGDSNSLAALTANLINTMSNLNPPTSCVTSLPTPSSGGNGMDSNGLNNQLLTLFPNLPPVSTLERFLQSSTSEMMEIIENLRTEDEIQYRVADMMADAAEQLRRSSQTRQATLDRLMDLLKKSSNVSPSGSSSNGTGPTTTDSSNLA